MKLIIILLCIILLLVLYLVTYKKNNNEHFYQTQESCTFDPTVVKPESKEKCILTCAKDMANNNCNDTECLKKCDDYAYGNFNVCPVTYQDLTSDTIEECTQKCFNYGYDGCNTYKDETTGDIVMYNQDIKKYNAKYCEDNPEDITNCSPCFKKCSERNYPDKDMCPINDSVAFKNSVGPFILYTIPESNKINIYWDVNSNDNIKHFIIVVKDNVETLIFKKDKTNFIRLEQTDDKPDGILRYTYIIDNLENNKEYTVNVNAVSNDFRPGVIMSNTLVIVPSETNLINYSNLSQPNTQYKKQNFLNNLLGKTFDISL